MAADLRRRNAGRTFSLEQQKSSAAICVRNGRRFTQKECRENLQPGVAEKLRGDLREEWPLIYAEGMQGEPSAWSSRKAPQRFAGEMAR